MEGIIPARMRANLLALVRRDGGDGDSFPCRHSRENEPEGRSFEERPSTNLATFVKKTIVIAAKAGIHFDIRQKANGFPPSRE